MEWRKSWHKEIWCEYYLEEIEKWYHRSKGSYVGGKWWHGEIKDDVNII